MVVIPSSRTRPGIHDAVDPVTGHRARRQQCVFQKSNGEICKNNRKAGRGKLCTFHQDVADRKADPSRGGIPGTVDSHLKSAVVSTMVKKHKTATGFVLDSQARRALDKLAGRGSSDEAGALRSAAGDPSVDPRVVLLDSVNSAWRQRQVWEAMLSSIPDEDYQHIGEPPLPGSVASSKGARIETIQRMLSEATKVAARTSKLAIDAGIEERLVRLAEDQAALIADTVRAGIVAAIATLVRELHLSPADADRATANAIQTAAGQLRLLASGPAEVIEGVAQAMPDKGELTSGGHWKKKRPVKVVSEAEGR